MIAGDSINHSFYTLEEALVYCIAYKYDGCSTRAVEYFFGGVGMKPHKDYRNHKRWAKKGRGK